MEHLYHRLRRYSISYATINKLTIPALDEDPVCHLVGDSGENNIGVDDAMAGNELICHPVPPSADLLPTPFDTAPIAALAGVISTGIHSLDGLGVSVGDRIERFEILAQDRL